MELLQELQDQIRASAEGRSPLSSLRRWLAGHVPAIHERGGPEAQDLSDSAWLLLSELDARERDEPTIRLALANLVGLQPPTAAPATEPVSQP